ncbi:MAG: hypothetical protein IJ899_20875 [Blautia sp.]|nr:hypothetical protein [Blautia sp.]
MTSRYVRETNLFSKSALRRHFEAYDTKLSVLQGEINAIISASEIDEYWDGTKTMYSQLAAAQLRIDALVLDFSSQKELYDGLSSDVTSMEASLASYKAGLDGLEADLSRVEQTLSSDYSTTAATRTMISASVSEVSSEISNLRTTLTSDYSTTEQTRSLIKQSSDSITSTITAFKKDVQDNYATTSSVTSAITQSANDIRLSVSSTYATKEEMQNVDSSTIKGVKVEYALSDSPTTEPQTGWSETAPAWQNGKYMWQRNATMAGGTWRYSDATCISGATGQQGIQGEKGDQCIPGKQGEKGEQGVQGNPGQNGLTSYFHIKYSQVENPTAAQMTETPSAYIGTYTDFVETDSTDPTKYTWHRFEGLQGEDGKDGIPGTNGADGVTYYLHIKYSDDGGETFTGNDGEDVGKYIGTLVDTNPEDPIAEDGYLVAGNKRLLTPDGKRYVVSTQLTELYTWAQIRGEDGKDGQPGLQGIQGEKGDQGVPGINGVNGLTSYFHIKYSPVENPTASQMTEVPSVYIGTYVDFTEEDSANPADYSWHRFEGLQGEQGLQGIPGTNGIDGTTHYLHIKYSNDGGTTFTGASGETPGDYIGTLVDENEIDSSRPADYTWAKVKGTGITSVTPQYYLSTSDSAQTGGSWVETPPEYIEGRYYWTRSKIEYDDGSDPMYTDPCLDTGFNQLNTEISSLKTRVSRTEIYASDEKIESVAWACTTAQDVIARPYIKAQTTAPASPREGDVWIDTGNDNAMMRYNGSRWVEIQDGDIARISGDLSDLATTVDDNTGSITSLQGTVSSHNGAIIALNMDVADLKQSRDEFTQWKTTASQKITDSAIISTVTGSATYINDMTGKVSVNDFSTMVGQWWDTVEVSAEKVDIDASSVVFGKNLVTVTEHNEKSLDTTGPFNGKFVIEGTYLKAVQSGSTGYNLCSYKRNPFATGDKVYYSLKGYAQASTRVYVRLRFYNESKQQTNQAQAEITLTTEAKEYNGTITLTNSAVNDAAYVCAYLYVSGSTTAYFRQVCMYRQDASVMIANGSLTANHLAADSVTADKIAANAVTADKISANAVTADKISANAVTAGKLAAGAVTAGTIAAGAVTASVIDVSNLSAISAYLGSWHIHNGYLYSESDIIQFNSTSFRYRTYLLNYAGGADYAIGVVEKTEDFDLVDPQHEDFIWGIKNDGSMVAMRGLSLQGGMSIQGGLSVDSLTLASGATVSGSATFLNALTYNGTSTFNNDATFTRDVYLNTNAILGSGVKLKQMVDGTARELFGYGSQLELTLGQDGITKNIIACIGNSGNGGSFRPVSNGQTSLGTSSYRWSAVYAANGVIQTSDEQEKDAFENLSEGKYKELFMAISPIAFRWKDGRDGFTHFGIGAQTFERDVERLGLMDIAAVRWDDGAYGVSYTEL